MHSDGTIATIIVTIIHSEHASRSPVTKVHSSPRTSWPLGICASTRQMYCNLACSGALSRAELKDALLTSHAEKFQRALSQNPTMLHNEQTWLLTACGQPAPNTLIVDAILRHRPELVHVPETGTGNTPLHLACHAQRPNADVVTLLLAHGASAFTFNSQGLSPFHVALLNPNDAEVRHLLVRKCGASLCNLPTATGETPAHTVAIHDRHLPALRFLHENGAQLHGTAVLVRDGRAMTVTPLQKARITGGTEAVRRFLELL